MSFSTIFGYEAVIKYEGREIPLPLYTEGTAVLVCMDDLTAAMRGAREDDHIRQIVREELAKDRKKR